MKKPFKNCSECVSFKHCYGDDDSFSWDNEKNCAFSCTKPYKGLGNDLVKIRDSEKHVSLKKAFRLGKEGRIIWEGYHEISFLDSET